MSTPTGEELLAAFDGSSPVPLTTSEVAEELGVSRRTAYNKLDKLVEEDLLETKEVGASARVWWRPGDRGSTDEPQSRGPAGDPQAHGPTDDPQARRPTDDRQASNRTGGGSTSLEDSRIEQLHEEQQRLVELIATGTPLEDCIVAVCEAISGLNPGVRASVVLADEGRESFQRPIAPDLEPAWGDGLEGVELGGMMFGTCGRAVVRGEPVTCEDVRTDDRWADEWRELCLERGILAGHSQPIRSADDDVVGSLMLCFDEPRRPTEWERRLAAFGTHVLGIALERERAERVRRETEERYQAFVTASSDIVYRMGPDWNEMRHLDGRELIPDTDEPQRSWVDEYIPPNERPRVEDAIAEATRTTSAFELEHQVVQVDGTRGWVLSRAVPITDDDGDIVEWLGTASDITERKEREAELERALDLLEKTERIADVGGWEIDVDTMDVFWTDHIFELLGLSGDEEPPLEEALDMYHEADQPVVEEAVETALESGEAFDIEARIWTGHDEKRWLRLQGVPEIDDGEVVSLRGAAQDITTRKERERELEESRQRYRTLVENFPNGAVALVDEDLTYRTAGGTPIDVDADTADDLEGRHIREAISDTLADALEPRYRAALDGESSTFELEIDGRYTQIHIFPVRNDDGEVFAAMGMSQDITERKEYERQLEASNDRLEQFAYAASHDLQEPLRMVSSYLQLLENRYSDELDEEGQEFVDFAVDGAERMRAMIDGLLEYSRVDRTGDPFEPVALDAVLEEVLEDLQLQIDESDADITTASLPRVEGDPIQLRELFQNLLDNAIEYSGDEPPRVHVSTDRDGDEWVVSVEDEGIGIDPGDQERVFEVFERLHSRSEHEGTGIGLALCQRIVERHGGDIWVSSEPGDGTTVSFTLPAAGG